MQIFNEIILQFSPVHPSIIYSYYHTVTTAIYASFTDNIAVTFTSGFSLRQHNDKSSYDGCNQYGDQQTPHIAIPQPIVFLKSQHIF